MRTLCQTQGAVKLSSECLASGVSAGTIGTHMVGVVVAVGENCDLMYGSEVWASCECVRPVCLGDLQSDEAQTFLIVVGEGWHDPHRWRDQLAVSAGTSALEPRCRTGMRSLTALVCMTLQMLQDHCDCESTDLARVCRWTRGRVTVGQCLLVHCSRCREWRREPDRI